MLPRLASRENVSRRALLSRLTLAVFADIGHKVKYECADPKVPLLGACRKSTRNIEPQEGLMVETTCFAKTFHAHDEALQSAPISMAHGFYLEAYGDSPLDAEIKASGTGL